MAQNFSGQNLQGKSFKGQDLSGCNFSAADIRSVNFTGAILKNANFSEAKAGVDPTKAGFLSLLVWVAAAFVGCFSVFTAVVINPQFSSFSAVYASITVLFLFAIFGWVTFSKSFEGGVLTVAVISSLAGTMGSLTWSDSLVACWTVAGLFVLVWFRVLLGVCALMLGGVSGGNCAGFLPWFLGFFAMLFGMWTVGINELFTVVWGFVSYIGVGIFCGYSCRRAWAGDLRFNFVLSLAVVFASRVGTCFRRADLTDANFHKAFLGGVDFRQAILTRTYFRESFYLFRARVEGTFLENFVLRDLVVTGNGRNQCFYGLSLKGVNLNGGSLEKSDLREVNLNESSLKNTCLKGANLSGVQLLGANLSGADLTAAIVGDLNVNSLTKFDNIVCDYVYLEAGQLKSYPPEEVFSLADFSSRKDNF